MTRLQRVPGEVPRALRGLARMFPVVLVLLPAALQAREGCTNKDFNGAFGFFATGDVVQSPVTSLDGAFARLGWLESDGNGHVKFSSTASFNSILIPQDFSGTYNVNSDCTMKAIVFLPDPFNLYVTFLGSLAEGGNEIREFFITPPGVLVFGTGRKMGLTGCADRHLAGSYQMELSGSILQQDSKTRLPFAALGKIDTDGEGNFVDKLASNVGGRSVQEKISGTYSVKPDCIFQLKYPASSESPGFTLKGVLIDKGTAANLMVLDPSAYTVLGSLRLQ